MHTNSVRAETTPVQSAPSEIPHSFARLPHHACQSPLSDSAYRVFGALMGCLRSRRQCAVTDTALGAACGKSEAAVSRALRELETAGWIARETHGPFRSIRLCFEFLGVKPPEIAPQAQPGAPPSPSQSTGSSCKRDEKKLGSGRGASGPGEGPPPAGPEETKTPAPRPHHIPPPPPTADDIAAARAMAASADPVLAKLGRLSLIQAGLDVPAALPAPASGAGTIGTPRSQTGLAVPSLPSPSPPRNRVRHDRR